MTKRGHITQVSADEAQELLARGTSTDWARVDAMTEADIEAAIASDPDEAGMDVDWETATVTLPQPKAVLHMRVDRDVLDFFRGEGRGYQTRINAVLRAYKDARTAKRSGR